MMTALDVWIFDDTTGIDCRLFAKLKMLRYADYCRLSIDFCWRSTMLERDCLEVILIRLSTAMKLKGNLRR